MHIWSICKDSRARVIRRSSTFIICYQAKTAKHSSYYHSPIYLHPLIFQLFVQEQLVHNLISFVSLKTQALVRQRVLCNQNSAVHPDFAWNEASLITWVVVFLRAKFWIVIRMTSTKKHLIPTLVVAATAYLLYENYFRIIPSPIVNTSSGKIRGTAAVSREGKTYYQFLGIPYAKPPVGPLRFEVRL